MTNQQIIRQCSSVIVDGPPANTSVDHGFHSPPDVTSATSVFEPITWTNATGEAYVGSFVVMIAGGAVQGQHILGPDETEATLPAMPAGSDSSMLFQGTKRAIVANCADLRDDFFCDKLAYTSEPIL